MPRSSPAARAALVLLPFLAFADAGTAPAASPIGGEFHVNQFSVSNQNDVQVAMSPGGTFVVVWQGQGHDNLPDYTFNGIWARRYDSAGVAIADEFQVNTYTPDHQDQPAVAINASGSFVVVWRSNADQDGAETGIFGQRFDSAGVRLAVEFMVNAFTADQQAEPDVVLGANGAFLVVWQSDTQDGDGNGVFARRFNSAGAPATNEIQVSAYTTGHQANPRLALGLGGETLVVWTSDDGSANGILARRVGPAGSIGAEFVVNTYIFSEQSLPAVASVSDGGFGVVWQSGHDGAPAGIFGRRFDSTGVALSSEFQVNTYTVGTQTVVDIASDGTDFIVVWQSANQDGDNDGVFARQVGGSGAAVGAEFQVNTYTTSGQRKPSVGMETDGEFVVAWGSFLQEGAGTAEGVFAQRFASTATAVLDVDGDGSVDALIDGALVLRHQFGFTGTTLTDGVDTAGCTRCDASEITTYLVGLGPVLDIDEDTANEPLTDGLLVLRSLLGFTGTTLTAGVVNTLNCGRCDAASIEPYLAGLD